MSALVWAERRLGGSRETARSSGADPTGCERDACHRIATMLLNETRFR